MRRVLLLVTCILASSGCGALITTGFIIQGSITLASAKSANAENLATYDYVSAQEYLAKAKESHSEADYEHSLRFARLAVEKAQKARTKALAARKVALPPTVEPESAPEPAPVPAPAPQATPAPAPGLAPYEPAPSQPNRAPIIIRKVPEDSGAAPGAK